MADKEESRPAAKPRPPQTLLPRGLQPRQRESTDDRRARQAAAALATQLNLKREAAERRERKSAS